MIVVADGYVCRDCLLMMANGEIDPDASQERCSEVAQATAGWCPASDDEHPDNEFSTAPCRTCQCRLYGSRHWAVMLGPNPHQTNYPHD